MRKVVTICAVATVLVTITGAANADSATMHVATANASNQFEILNGGSQLYYKPQPDTVNNWYYNDGSLVTYTRNEVTAPRDGMKTYAATSVAYGAAFGSLSLSFDYIDNGETDPNGVGLVYQGYPTLNFAITDGVGTYAIWSATSGGTAFTTAPIAGKPGWNTLTLDLTTLADDSIYGKVNESTNEAVLLNGKLSDTTVEWSDIKNWTMAGFYTEQFNPTGGFGAWDATLWDTLSTPDDPDTTEVNEYTNTNQFGVSLNWGDTVGSMYGDGNGAWWFCWETAWDSARDASEFQGAIVTHWRATTGDRTLGDLREKRQTFTAGDWQVTLQRGANRLITSWESRKTP